MRFRRLLLPCLVLSGLLALAACGDEGPPKPQDAPQPTPDGETWHYDPEAMMRLVQNRDPGGMAWIPAATLADLEANDMRDLGVVVALLRDALVARVTLYEDQTFELTLRAEGAERAWRTVTAFGTWAEDGDDRIALRVARRESRQMAPLEIADALTLRRVGEHLHLEALGRTIPFAQVPLLR